MQNPGSLNFLGAYPTTTVTPFTYREGATMLHIMEKFKNWALDMGPEVQAIIDESLALWQVEFDKLEDKVNLKIDEWDTLFNAFMANVVAELEALNDQAVANLVNSPASLLRIALDARFTKIGDNVANVLDFGAKGDGVTDDTVAIEAARDHVRNKHGATVLYPPGVYVQANVTMLSNVVYSGYGAIITPVSYNAFRGKSDTRRGYGAGGVNTVFEGFTFKGDFTAFDKAAAITLHHADGVTFRDCTFDEAVLGGHAIDLAGSRNIVIDSCKFAGFNPPSGRQYAECIQIDHSTASGVSNQDAAQSYDGLPCVDITITNCQFLPKTVLGTTYHAPNPFGAHATLKDNHKRITFEGNTVINPFPSRNSNAIVAPIHFQGVEDLRILNNYFGGHSHPTSLIKLISYSTGIGPGDISNPNPGSGGPVGVRASRNIFIEGNTFEGFDSTENKALINVRGADLGTLSPENIIISGNIFKDSLPAGLRGNVGSNLVGLLYCKNVQIDGNIVSRARSLIFASSVDDIAVRNNVIEDTEWVTIHLEGTTGEGARVALVSGNLIDGAGTAIYVGNTDSAVISGNTITRPKDGQSLAGYANGNITVSDSDAVSVVSNSVHGVNPVNINGSIQFLSSVTRGAGVGNTSLGWVNTVYVDASSSAKNVGNVTI